MVTYEEFINNILETRGRFNCGDEYHERHHILPKCLGGGNEDENLIDLYAREHFEAHRLLALENPDNNDLSRAWFRMSFGKNQERITHIVTPKEYEDARIAFRNSMLGENNPFYGKHHNAETRKKQSESNKNKIVTFETRQKLSEALKGRIAPNKGVTRRTESNKKQSESMIGKYAGINNPRSRRVIRLSDLKIYDCAKFAAEDNDVCYATITYRCKTHKDFMYYDEYLTIQNELKEVSQ